MTAGQQVVSQAEFARLIGVERSYVTALKKAGRLVLNAIGNVLVEESRRRIAETADPGKSGVVERHARNREEQNATVGQKNLPKTESDSSDGDEPVASPDYQAARARKELANAQLAEMEVREKAGELFDAAEAIAIVADAGAVFRTTLDARRPLLVSQLAMMADESEIRIFLEEQDEHLLADLSARFDAMGESA
jgi:hypothetical protein